MHLTEEFACLGKEFPPAEMPFLRRAKRRAIRTRPYRGLRILHHAPVTLETALKIEVLALGGARLTVTNPSFVSPDPRAVDLMRQAGISVEDSPARINHVDIAMDCGGELSTVTEPRLGACELTGSGTSHYRQARPEYPVIAVDECRIKDLETLLGTGEAFVHAFQQQVSRPLDKEAFLIFGFGKVGKGIGRALRRFTDDIQIVETDPAALSAAERAGYEAVSAADIARVESCAERSFAIVTATGVASVVSDRYDPAPFRGKVLANLGADDEFGAAFAANEVLHDKQPMNFAVSSPALMRYLDPVFYAHNLAVDLLLTGWPRPGVHPFPSFWADEVVDEWQLIFGERLDDQ